MVCNPRKLLEHIEHHTVFIASSIFIINPSILSCFVVPSFKREEMSRTNPLSPYLFTSERDPVAVLS